ncbi:hypothetical protein DL764_006708 [Monosporascus ibericus]|uniref:Uncharacterized protein n=1 Tax=Monosporascus ibericus TaxID=155417 RepID=A0A4Q4T607_9PEZI|nr:hypothetical protein DL764_006708 [Monosporascus ibericus]
MPRVLEPSVLVENRAHVTPGDALDADTVHSPHGGEALHQRAHAGLGHFVRRLRLRVVDAVCRDTRHEDHAAPLVPRAIMCRATAVATTAASSVASTPRNPTTAPGN